MARPCHTTYTGSESSHVYKFISPWFDVPSMTLQPLPNPFSVHHQHQHHHLHLPSIRQQMTENTRFDCGFYGSSIRLCSSAIAFRCADQRSRVGPWWPRSMGCALGWPYDRCRGTNRSRGSRWRRAGLVSCIEREWVFR